MKKFVTVMFLFVSVPLGVQAQTPTTEQTCALLTQADICVGADVVASLKAKDKDTLVAALWDEKSGSRDVTLDYNRLKFELWMPHHGHGSSPLKVTVLPNTRTVLLEDAFFVMAGHWVLRVSHLDEQGKLIEQVDVKLPEVKKGHGGGHHHP